jgi:hypothetical protein
MRRLLSSLLLVARAASIAALALIRSLAGRVISYRAELALRKYAL